MEKIKVLLVDDDLDFGNTAVLLLKKAGYEVYFQNTLFGVESLIMKLSPNLIILDVMIGEENSLERINDIRLAAEDIPIMCVSSLHDPELKTEAANNGAMIYIEKPFDSREFLGWVNRYAKRKDFSNSRMILHRRYRDSCAQLPWLQREDAGQYRVCYTQAIMDQ